MLWIAVTSSPEIAQELPKEREQIRDANRQQMQSSWDKIIHTAQGLIFEGMAMDGSKVHAEYVRRQRKVILLFPDYGQTVTQKTREHFREYGLLLPQFQRIFPEELPLAEGEKTLLDLREIFHLMSLPEFQENRFCIVAGMYYSTMLMLEKGKAPCVVLLSPRRYFNSHDLLPRVQITGRVLLAGNEFLESEILAIKERIPAATVVTVRGGTSGLRLLDHPHVLDRIRNFVRQN
ncbi:MAG: hypothetical protein HS115_15465 [Spirochaetales bacterium]|nr:hypothetical protein [Spirochaetales bacterium]